MPTIIIVIAILHMYTILFHLMNIIEIVSLTPRICFRTIENRPLL